MAFYPDLIHKRALSAAATHAVPDANAGATAASFSCGAFVHVELRVDPGSGTIVDAGFRTNGCGFMVAAAGVVCEWLSGIELRELHGLDEQELSGMVRGRLGDMPADRRQCESVVFEALRTALADFRRARIDEFRGEKALICTCFGVEEETIVELIANREVSDLEGVMEKSRAGTGCGSCRMLIEELIAA